MSNKKVYEDVCATCKSYSTTSIKKATHGFCMKLKRTTGRTDSCGFYRPNIKIKYAMECKPQQGNYQQPKSKFSN